MSLIILLLNWAYTNMTRMAAHPRSSLLYKWSFRMVTKDGQLTTEPPWVRQDLQNSQHEFFCVSECFGLDRIEF